MPARKLPVPMVATYRLQLRPNFGFAEAAAIVPYLCRLGISHVYTAPIVTAAPGSEHRYDITDPTRIAEDIGGERGLDELVAVVHAHGMGLVVDVVPNHLAAHPANPAWWDVLRRGRSSEFAHWFDISWEHGNDRIVDRLLLPVLGEDYGDALHSGTLRVSNEIEGPAVAYHGHRFPLTDSTRAELAALGEVALVALNADPDRVHDVLEQQHYRVAHWRTGGESLDYRRFFDVTTLIGVRVEDDDVFGRSHAVLLDRVRRGDVDGLRIDHPDGLADPTGYLQRLRAAAPSAWIVVEKILQGAEQLRSDWPVHGTTGYETSALIDRLFVDPAGEAALTELTTQITGVDSDLAAIVAGAKRLVTEQLLPGEVQRLADDLGVLCDAGSGRIDATPIELRDAVAALLVEMPVYRTYARDDAPMDDVDRRIVDQAVDRLANRDDLHQSVVRRLAAALVDAPDGDEIARRLRRRFQQTSGPVMAKGVEDTAFYRFPRLASLNEVGADPSRWGVCLDEFHRAQLDAAARSPQRMVSTSTHDSKRSEDVRARISALSEFPQRWARAANALHERAAALGTIGDPVVGHLLHQTFLAANPIDADRAGAYACKAAREAKRATSWLRPDEAYETALSNAVTAWLGDRQYRQILGALAADIDAAATANSLAAKLIALTVPGVPDLYQGSEHWTDSLVDPDNRRPVTFPDSPDLTNPKVHLVAQTLAVRHRHPHSFGPDGSYTPIRVGRDHASIGEHLVAYLRGDDVVVLATRWTVRLASNAPAGSGWGAAVVDLPAGNWHDVLSDRPVRRPHLLAELFGGSSVALLERR